jgi:uncharacterized cofD-like protein
LSSNKLKIVSIGGGTGLSTLLRGLKKCPVDVAAIVTVMDDGGSSGRLRDELGVLPPGDIRNCLIALSEDENLMARLFRYRFTSDGGLHGHSFGNLFLTAMAGVTGDFAEAVRLTSEVLAINGVIYPATNSSVSLRAQFVDDTWVEGETAITAARKQIRRVYLSPADAEPLTDALRAIMMADVITLGPGSLYTSLVPNLLVNEIVDTIRESNATKIYIQNIMTQPGETADYRVGDHVSKLMDHCSGLNLFPNVIINSGVPSSDILKRYESEGSSLVRFSRERLTSLGLRIMERDLLADDTLIRHDPDRLARAVLEMAGFARAHHV